MKINFTKKKAHPKTEGNIAVTYGPAKRVASYLKWRLTILLVLSPFIYFLLKLLFSFFIAPSTGFISLDVMNYYSPGNGIVVETYAEKGASVEKGDLLVVLRNINMENTLAQLNTRLRFVNERVQEPEPSDNRGDILRSQLHRAKKSLAFVESRYKDTCFLFEQGAATLAELASAKDQLDIRRERILTLQSALSQWQQNRQDRTSRFNDDFGKIMAEKAQLEQQIAQLGDQLGQYRIKAVEQGRVIAANIKPDQYVTIGDSLLAVTHQDGVRITAFLPPKQTSLAPVGKELDVILPSKTVVRAVVQYEAHDTGRLPAYLSTPMLGRQRMVVVDLKPLSPIPPEEMVDGLPVEVMFDTKYQRLWQRFKNAIKAIF